MKRILSILILTFSVLIINGCSEKEDNMKSDVKKGLVQIENEFTEFSNIVDSNKNTLVPIYDWLYAKDGSFDLYIEKDGKIDIDTEKGESYEKNNEKIEILVDLMKKNNFTEFMHCEITNEMRLTRIKYDGQSFEQHMLVYSNTDINSDFDYRKIDDNFYYLYAVGE